MTKILLAEDNKFLVKVYEAKLTKAGFDVRIANDGTDVGTILQTFIPDIFYLI